MMMTNNETHSNSKKDDVKKHKKHGRGPERESPVKQFLTSVAHFCLFAFALFIVRLCFSYPFDLFTWHPLLMSVGWTFLVSEGILIISKENSLTKKLKLNNLWKERIHWIILTVASVLIGIGFLTVTISKNSRNKEHYTTWHGTLGLMAVIFYTPLCLNGIPLLYRGDLKKYIDTKYFKILHVGGGALTYVYGGLALILSVYTKWFARNTGNNLYVFVLCLFMISFPVLWIFQRPAIKIVKGKPEKKNHEKDEKSSS